MPIHNSDIVEVLNKVADLLDIRGENRFRIRAYRNAARTVGSLPQNVTAILEEGKDLAELPGLGRDLTDKIGEIVKTGTLKLLEELEEKTPGGLTELLTLPRITSYNVCYTKLLRKVNFSSAKKINPTETD